MWHKDIINLLQETKIYVTNSDSQLKSGHFQEALTNMRVAFEATGKIFERMRGSSEEHDLKFLLNNLQELMQMIEGQDTYLSRLRIKIILKKIDQLLERSKA